QRDPKLPSTITHDATLARTPETKYNALIATAGDSICHGGLLLVAASSFLQTDRNEPQPLRPTQQPKSVYATADCFWSLHPASCKLTATRYQTAARRTWPQCTRHIFTALPRAF